MLQCDYLSYPEVHELLDRGVPVPCSHLVGRLGERLPDDVESCALVSRSWLRSWEGHVRSPSTAPSPGPITNESLLDASCKKLRPNLTPDAYVAILLELFTNVLQPTYGGRLVRCSVVDGEPCLYPVPLTYLGSRSLFSSLDIVPSQPLYVDCTPVWSWQLHRYFPSELRRSIYTLMAIWTQSETPNLLVHLPREVMYLLFEALSIGFGHERPVYRLIPPTTSLALAGVKAFDRLVKVPSQALAVHIHEQPQAENLRYINDYMLLLHSPLLHEQLAAALTIRKLVCRESGADVDPLIQPDVLELLFKLMKTEDTALLAEVSWILTNVCGSQTEHTDAVVNAGGIALFVPCLDSTHKGLVEQALLAFGNIAGNGVESRDRLLEFRLLQRGPAFVQHPHAAVGRAAAWMLANICRTPPLPPVEDFRECLAMLESVVPTTQDESIRTDLLWTLVYISNVYPEAISHTALLQHVIASLQFNQNITPAVRIIGNLSAGPDICTARLLRLGACGVLFRLLQTTSKHATRRELLWIFSNIAAGPPAHAHMLLLEGVLDSLIAGVPGMSNKSLVHEVCYIFRNLLDGLMAGTQLLERRVLFHLLQLVLKFDQSIERLEQLLEQLYNTPYHAKILEQIEAAIQLECSADNPTVLAMLLDFVSKAKQGHLFLGVPKDGAGGKDGDADDGDDGDDDGDAAGVGAKSDATAPSPLD